MILVNAACRQVPAASGPQPGIFDKLQALNGKRLAGEVIYPTGREMPFQNVQIWTEIKVSQKEVLIPIYLGQEKVYRTLVLGKDEQGFYLRHENLKDGRHAEISMYGGHTKGSQSNYLLMFPADPYSRQLLGPLRDNVWSLAINNDKTILSYIAEENGHLSLQIDFDLTGQFQLQPQAVQGNKSEESPKLRKR